MTNEEEEEEEEEPLLEISFKLLRKMYMTSFAVSSILGFESYDQLIVDLIQRHLQSIKRKDGTARGEEGEELEIRAWSD
jgi:hypothetical protein